MELWIGKTSAQALAKVYDTPLYVYDKNIILARIQQLKEAFPQVEIAYAIKANHNPIILKLIASQGIGADCSNWVELTYAKNAGFSMNHSSMTAVNPRDEDLREALELGVNINLDDISILKRLLKLGKPERLAFRVNPGFGKGKFPSICVGGPGSKFGMNEDLAREAFRLAKESGISRFGIHMMTGSCVLHEDYFEEITLAIQEIAERIGTALDIQFEYINIGGGLGVPYEPHEKALDIQSVGEKVRKAFTYPATLCIEPGRFLIAEAGSLLTQVTTVKGKFIGVDAGMATLLRPALYGAYHPIVLTRDTNAPMTQEANIVGPFCEATDFFAKNRAMPELHEGDILAIQVAGAYCASMASTYNGSLLPEEVMVDEENHESIAKRGTVELPKE